MGSPYMRGMLPHTTRATYTITNTSATWSYPLMTILCWEIIAQVALIREIGALCQKITLLDALLLSTGRCSRITMGSCPMFPQFSLAFIKEAALLLSSAMGL